MYSLWAHGNALVVENPSDVVGVAYRGWGAEVRVKAEAITWFHLPIPTALVADDESAVLMAAYLNFIVDGAGEVLNVVVYAGAVNIYESGPIGPGSGGVGSPYRATLELPPRLAIGGPVNLAINYEAYANFDANEPAALFTALSAGIGFDYARRPLEERDFSGVGERFPVGHR